MLLQWENSPYCLQEPAGAILHSKTFHRTDQACSRFGVVTGTYHDAGQVEISNDAVPLLL
jgi:hypothetical protein